MASRGDGLVGGLFVAIVVLLVVGGIGVAQSKTADESPAAADAVGGGSASFEGSAAPDPCAAPTWVAAWAAPPQDSTAEQAPQPAPGAEGDRPKRFEHQTLRLVVTPTAAGTRTRLHLSNRFGEGPVTFGSVHVARRASGAAIVAGTDRAVTFGGSPAVTIPAGGTVVTDEIDMAVEPFADLAVSIHVADAVPLDLHLVSQQTQFLSPPGSGDRTGDGGGEAFTQRLGSWLALTAIDVLAPRRTGTVVAIGDSITDGVGSTPDANQRWTDHLAWRVMAEAEAPAVTVVGAAISGNQVTRDNVFSVNGIGWGMGPSAVTRLGPDVVEQAGVTDVVVFIGINDLYMPTGPDPAGAIIEGYRQIIERARAAGLRVIGTTMTPGGLQGEKEAQRNAVNDWVRGSGAFDAVVDLDAAVRDPADPTVVASHLGVDPVHLNDAGSAAVARAFDLRLFQGTGC
ncbi:MAG: GDSL-type esterase/lipase family protein [Actinomycetota bacterium]